MLHNTTPNDTVDTLQTKGRSRSREKHQQIFQAAARLFADQGYEGTSMDQIAEAAGVSKQTVYSHFGDKEGLFVASIRQKCILNSLDTQLFNSQLPIRDTLLKLSHHFSELLLSDEAVRMYRLCVTGAEQYPQVSRMYFQAGPQNLVDMLTDYLQTKADKGELAVENAAHAAWQFLLMLKGDAYYRAVLGLEPEQAQQQLAGYLHSCVDMFLRAYRA